jgi:hypothetical protein
MAEQSAYESDIEKKRGDSIAHCIDAFRRKLLGCCRVGYPLYFSQKGFFEFWRGDKKIGSLDYLHRLKERAVVTSSGAGDGASGPSPKTSVDIFLAA